MGLTSGLQLPFGIQPVNPVPVDAWSGPYIVPTEISGLTEANASIPTGARFVSMEVRMVIAGKSAKYWYYSGTTDADLVAIETGGSGGNNVTNPVNNGVLVSDGTSSGIAASEILQIDSSGTVIFSAASVTGLTGTTVVLSFNKAIGSAYYFDYRVEHTVSGSTRSGTVIANWRDITTEYVDTSTPDIFGSTDGISFSVAISGANIQLTAEITSGTWDIKIGTRAI